MQILGLREGCSARLGSSGWQEGEERLRWDLKRSKKRGSRSRGQIIFAEEGAPTAVPTVALTTSW